MHRWKSSLTKKKKETMTMTTNHRMFDQNIIMDDNYYCCTDETNSTTSTTTTTTTNNDHDNNTNNNDDDDDDDDSTTIMEIANDNENHPTGSTTWTRTKMSSPTKDDIPLQQQRQSLLSTMSSGIVLVPIQRRPTVTPTAAATTTTTTTTSQHPHLLLPVAFVPLVDHSTGTIDNHHNNNNNNNDDDDDNVYGDETKKEDKEYDDIDDDRNDRPRRPHHYNNWLSWLPNLPTTIRSSSSSSSLLPTTTTTSTTSTTSHRNHNHHTLRLLFGIGGIYISFLYYGTLQEDIFRYHQPYDISTATTILQQQQQQQQQQTFTQAWFLQAMESLINICVGYIGILLYGSGFRTKTTTTTTTIIDDDDFHPPPTTTNTSLSSSKPTAQSPTSVVAAATTTTTSTTTTSVPNHPNHPYNYNVGSITKSSSLKPLIQLQSSSPKKLYQYHRVPHVNFCISGMAQVSAKACTSMALSYGLSYPIATLTKSGKMAPVMIGSIYYGNATYTIREYVQVLLIIFGTAIVSYGSRSNKHSSSSSHGNEHTHPTDDSIRAVLYILISLVFDGITAGYQKRFQYDMTMANIQPKSYDFMYYTNLYMFGTAIVIAMLNNEITTGMTFLYHNPILLSQIIQFTICSAIGQSFIYYTLSNFDPLLLSTVTTTRKIFSVLLSILSKGHALSYTGWTGIVIACSGIASEIHSKISTKKHAS